jgi:hypothetical protein
MATPLTPTQTAIVREMRGSWLYIGEIATRLAHREGYVGPANAGHYLQKEIDELVRRNVVKVSRGNAGRRAYFLAALYDGRGTQAANDHTVGGDYAPYREWVARTVDAVCAGAWEPETAPETAP